MEEELENTLKNEDDAILRTIGSALERTNNELKKLEKEGKEGEWGNTRKTGKSRISTK